MSIPLWMYLYRIHRRTVWLRVAIAGAAVLSAASALGSQSRGALLALVATTSLSLDADPREAYLWGCFPGRRDHADFIHAGHLDRAHEDNYPETGERDQSSQGRLEAWAMLTNLALDRPVVGGGFDPYSPQVWNRVLSKLLRASFRAQYLLRGSRRTWVCGTGSFPASLVCDLEARSTIGDRDCGATRRRTGRTRSLCCRKRVSSPISSVAPFSISRIGMVRTMSWRHWASHATH